MSAAGLFITVEGIDGVGKTTQAQMLAAWLGARGREVVLTREPGGTPLGESLRRLLLHESTRVGAVTELMLYAADRAQHVDQVIRPALEAGRTVVCERYSDSTAAYQGYGRGLDLDFIRGLDRFATAGLEPDLTLLLEGPPEVARQRLVARPKAATAVPTDRDLAASTPDRLEREDAAFHQRVAAGYRELARACGGRIRVIDATAAPAVVFQSVAREVEAFLAHR